MLLFIEKNYFTTIVKTTKSLDFINRSFKTLKLLPKNFDLLSGYELKFHRKAPGEFNIKNLLYKTKLK